MFHCASLTSEEVRGPYFNLTRLDKYTARDSSTAAGHFDMTGATIASAPSTRWRCWRTSIASRALSVGWLFADLRLVKRDNIGRARASEIDHRAFNGMRYG